MNTNQRSRRGGGRSSRSGQSSYRGGRRYTARPQHKSKSHRAHIDPSMFVNRAVEPMAEEVYTPSHTFADFGFDVRLAKLIEQKGYKHPTPIQDKSIKEVMAGHDIVGLANTGTGKTAAFILPVIDRLLHDPRNTTLIVVPTRELATQINDEFRSFTHGLKLYAAVCVGGVKIGPQIQALRRNPHVIIATPGRLRDLMENHSMPINRCRTIVLDEVDRMLDMGFVREIEFFIAQLPREHQSLCFSATITPQIRRVIDSIAQDPVTISVSSNVTSDHVEQDVIRVSSGDEKLEKLIELLGQEELQKVLIFGETKHGVQRLSDKLAKRGIKTAAIHGNKTQPQRQRALDALKKDQIQALVATDVVARGLDIPAVSHVINFDLPQSYEDYIHRIGRTGRAGKSGKALTFISK